MYPEMVDYTQACREFSWEVSEPYNFAVDVVKCWAEDARKAAMLWVDEQGGKRRLSFSDFAVRSSQVGNAVELRQRERDLKAEAQGQA